MACCNNTATNCSKPCGRTNNGALLIIVLYILLAIIIGSYV